MKLLEEAATSSIFKNGYWYYFDVDGYKITAFGSAWTGKEVIFAGEEIVSIKRNFRKNSYHPFQIGNNRYQIEFKVISILRGVLECSLYCEDKLIQSFTKKISTHEIYFSKTQWTLLFILGFLTGFFLPRLLGW